MAHHASRFLEDRRSRREFRALLAAIIHHAAAPDTEPAARNPFVCPTCGHAASICTCAPFYRREVRQ